MLYAISEVEAFEKSHSMNSVRIVEKDRA